MSSTDAKIHPAQDLIYALQNTEPYRPLVTLGNAHKEALRSLADILEKSTNQAEPPRVPIKEVYPEKLQQVD